MAADHAGNADVHIRGFPLRAMLPLLLLCEFSQSRKSAGWRLAFGRFWLALYIMEWSGVEWEAFLFQLERVGWLSIYPFSSTGESVYRGSCELWAVFVL